jgi:hypothetical protein
MAKQDIKNLELEGCSLLFKNFSGRPGPFNDEGERSFSVLIEDPEFAHDLLALGWNVRELQQEDEEESRYHISVKVNYNSSFPPRIYMVREDELVPLHEEQVAMLDYRVITSADVSINPYRWRVSGKTGVSAYLSSMYVEVESTMFDHKYDGMRVR